LQPLRSPFHQQDLSQARSQQLCGRGFLSQSRPPGIPFVCWWRFSSPKGHPQSLKFWILTTTPPTAVVCFLYSLVVPLATCLFDLTIRCYEVEACSCSISRPHELDPDPLPNQAFLSREWFPPSSSFPADCLLESHQAPGLDFSLCGEYRKIWTPNCKMSQLLSSPPSPFCRRIRIAFLGAAA